MNQRGATVMVDLHGSAVTVGKLLALRGRSGERAAFQYDDMWLRHPERFALEPALHLDPSPQYPPGFFARYC